MSNLSELLPAGGSAKEFEAVASGTLPNGKAVILKANGQVEAVAETTTTISENIPVSSELVFESAQVSFVCQAHVSDNKFIIAYRDKGNSNYGTAIVATISGTQINFGTPVVFNAGTTGEIGLDCDATTGKCVIAYQDESSNGYGRCVVGTISGFSVSFGTEVTFLSGYANFCSVAFNPNTSNQCVIAYRYQAGSPYNGRSRLGTVSGTSISFTNETAFSSGGTEGIAIAMAPNISNKFVITYKSGTGLSVVGTISGTSISYGSPVTVYSGYDAAAISFDPTVTNRFVIAFQDSSGSRYGRARIGQISGTTIGYGAVATYNTGNTQYNAVAFDPLTSGSFVIGYRDSDNNYYGTIRVCTTSGTTITLGSDTVINSGNSLYFGVTFSSKLSTQGQFLASYVDYTNNQYGTSRTGQISTPVVTTNLTSTNLLGTSTAAFTNGQTATIVPKGGVSTNQSSLTIGSTYYVQVNGTVSTVSTSPAVILGKAVSSTSLILKGNS
jgi:hypothetical protein